MLSFFICLSLLALLAWLGFSQRIPSGRVFGGATLLLGLGLAYSHLKSTQAAPQTKEDPTPPCADAKCAEDPSELEPEPDPIGAGSDEVNVEEPARNGSDAGVEPITCTNPKGCGDPKAQDVK